MRIKVWVERLCEERFIRHTLRRLARQRVATILQPGNVWVVQGSPADEPRTDAALSTCLVRGWVEILHHAVPSGEFTKPEELTRQDVFPKSKPVYRLTEGGWHAINRTHGWLLATFAVGVLGVIATVAGLWIASASGSSSLRQTTPSPQSEQPGGLLGMPPGARRTCVSCDASSHPPECAEARSSCSQTRSLWCEHDPKKRGIARHLRGDGKVL